MVTDSLRSMPSDLFKSIESAPAPRRGGSVSINGREIGVTPVFYAYWKFAAERQNIFFRRHQGQNNLTSDPILRQYKFTNAYRASDRVSQFLIKSVIYRDDLPDDCENVFFRTLLFKIFNRIETWQSFEQELGPITWERFSFKKFDSVLTHRIEKGERNYSAAYIMPSGGTTFGFQAKHQNHLKLLHLVMHEKFPARLQACRNMSAAYELLLSAPTIGPFLAYQYVTDLNYTQIVDFGEDEFVVAGPGALDGIGKCFDLSAKFDASEIITYMWKNQHLHFAEQGLAFQDLWGRPLQLIDCQNVFCEISKYARVAFPEYAGISGRTRIKQKFVPAPRLPKPWYPPKWGINEKAAL